MLRPHSFYNYDVAYSDNSYPKWTHKQVYESICSHIKLKNQENETYWCHEKLKQLDKDMINSSSSPEKLSFQCFANRSESIRIGIIQLHGKTMDDEDIRCDVPFQLSFLWRFPITFSKDHCLQVWNTLKSINSNIKIDSTFKNNNSEFSNQEKNYSLEECVYYIQYLEAPVGQRFNFNRKSPYLRLVFINKQDFNRALSWLNQFDISDNKYSNDFIKNCNKNNQSILNILNNTEITSFSNSFNHASGIFEDESVEARTLTSHFLNLPQLPESKFKILLFETKIKFDCAWNREWGNPNSWINLNERDYYIIDSELQERTTTCPIYLFVTHPSKLHFDSSRLDIPPLIIEVWDLETKGLDAENDPEFQIFTSTSVFFKEGGIDKETKKILEPRLISIEATTWQPSDSITGITIFQEKNEEDLLRRIIRQRREHGTNKIITHNGISFDMVVFLQRIIKLGLTDLMAMGKDLRERSRVKRKGENGEYMGVSHNGIIHLDTIVFYKTFNPEIKSKSLKSILNHFFDNEIDAILRETLDKMRDSQHHSNSLIRDFCKLLESHMLINSKQDVHFKEIPVMFFSKDTKQVKTLLEYNITDVFQTARLATTHNVILMSLAFCQIFGITGNVFYSQGSEIQIMAGIWKRISDLGMIYNVYQYTEDDPYSYSSPQMGASVQDSIEGVHSGVAILDVASEYPSTILEYLLCKCRIIEKKFLSESELIELQQKWAYRQYVSQEEEFIVIDGKWKSEIHSNEYSPQDSNIEWLTSFYPEMERDLKFKERGIERN